MPDAESTIPGSFPAGDKVSDLVRVVIFGPGGAGKTTLVGTLPGRGLVIDIPQIEGGDFVLSDKRDRIDVKRLDGWLKDPAPEKATDPTNMGIQEIFDFLMYKKHPYKWVAMDSLTALTELAIRKIIRERPGILGLDPHKITLPEWGQVGRLVGEMVYQFHKLPIHVIWTAQERVYSSDDDSGIPSFIGPSTSPSALLALIPPQVLVGRLTVAENTDDRHLMVKSSSKYKTKIRAKPGRDMPAVILHPNLSTILRYALGPDDAERPQEVTAAEPVSNVLEITVT